MASARSRIEPGTAPRRPRGSARTAAAVAAIDQRVVPEAPSEGTLSRERVGDLQRTRILAAMVELVRERGVGGVTVAHVVERSGVSRRTFYELFEDREGCLLAAFEHAVSRVSAAVLPVYQGAGGGSRWQERVRAGLGAALGFLDDEPTIGGLLIVDSLAAEHRVLERRARILDTLVDTVHRGARAHAPTVNGNRGAAPRIVAEGVVGGVLGVVHARLLDGGPRRLSGLLNQLMAMVVLPYLGPGAAARELEYPTPRARRRAPATRDPLRELDMRLTYRTVRVLLAIAERPEASGRQVADASGISDQGQMSKLLARLEHLGLIHNSAHGRGKGEPNAWTLTESGCQVERAIRAQTGS